MNRPAITFSQTKLNFFMDAGIFILLVVISATHSVSDFLHEWLTLLFIAPLLIHILLHWKWLTQVTKRFLGRLPGDVRFNYLWNFFLFILMTGVVFSGFMISRSLLPAFGFRMGADRFWKEIHEVSADLLFVFLGVHLGMHWDWIWRRARRYVFFMSDRRVKS